MTLIFMIECIVYALGVFVVLAAVFEIATHMRISQIKDKSDPNEVKFIKLRWRLIGCTIAFVIVTAIYMAVYLLLDV